MRNFDFKFANSYQGYWKLGNTDEELPGVLYVEKHDIRLELFWNNYLFVEVQQPLFCKGYAYAKNAENRTCYYFTLNELYCTQCSVFGNKQSQYTFDVNSFFITDKPNIEFDGIRSFCIRTSLMDKWVRDFSLNCFDYEIAMGKYDPINLVYTPKKPLSLFDSEHYNVYLMFGYGYSNPSAKGFVLTTHTFINVDLKNMLDFEDATEIAEQTIWLLSILWDNLFVPDFIEYRTKDSEFIFKQSDRYSYKYHDVENNALRTSISDFSLEEISSIIEGWQKLIDTNRNSVMSFFETQFNGHMSPSTCLKNYVTVIDGITSEMAVETNGRIQDGKRTEEMKRILSKIVNVLSKEEYNRLSNAVFRQSPRELKFRLKCFLEKIAEYVILDLDDDFYIKVIDTRNHITHTGASNDNAYPPTMYRDVSYCLEKLILAYFLSYIGVSKEIAYKIVENVRLKTAS